MNETINHLFNRTSLRKFSQKPISSEHINLIVKSAMRAPTAGNLMLYTMIKVENKDTLEKLSVSCDNQPFIKTSSLAIIFLVDYQRMYDYFEYNGVKDFAMDKYKEYLLPSTSELLLGSADALIAAQNSVISAESLNIGSCYIGDILENYEYHRDLFDLPKYTFPIGMLVYGYYPDKINRTPRERFSEKYILHNEKYQRFSKEELDDMYSMNKLNPNNTFEAKNYAQFTYARKIGSEFSKEMKRSVNTALKNWSGK